MAPYNNVTVRPIVEPEIMCTTTLNIRKSASTPPSTPSPAPATNGVAKSARTSPTLDNLEKPAIKGYKGIFGEYQTELVWHNIIPIALINVVTFAGMLTFPWTEHKMTVAWAFVVGITAGFGVTAGVHRYYCHRTFKASYPIQILFIILYSAAGHNPIFEWVRDHRVHHKYSETDADPHNSNRGFFFSHVGWLFLKKHPDVIAKGKQIDMSDILNDPLVTFHDKHFIILRVFICFLLPSMVPVYAWGECWKYALMSQCLARYCFVLHMTWSVNSFAHLYGSKPFDATINPRENRLVAFFAMGEGWHNYHHTFPWDYRASEHGRMNITLHVLNFFERVGLIYDTKRASDDLIKRVLEKRGEVALAQNDGKGHHHHMPMVEFDEDLGY